MKKKYKQLECVSPIKWAFLLTFDGTLRVGKKIQRKQLKVDFADRKYINTLKIQRKRM